MDDETRQLLLKKTWCHGQLVLPCWSLVLLAWFFHLQPSRPYVLFVPILTFPAWFYISYKSVFSDFNGRQLAIGGFVAEVSHVIVLVEAVKDLSDTWNLIICIVSALFLIETAAFLCVVTAFRPKERPRANMDVGGSIYQDPVSRPLV